MVIEAGQTLGHYRIESKIGEGGMGEVWAATDTRLNRPAAIKSLPPAVAADPERLARFKREAQLLAALAHPNIAAIYGLEQVGETPYLALELVEGEELAARMAGRTVPLDEALEMAGQIAAALQEAHDKGIVHRDLKPANVKVTREGQVKVLDFGLAKALSADPETSEGAVDPSLSPTLTAALGTQAGLILGTAAYMAPEQARGKAVDRRADIWAFGVILFEMLTGERLFVGETVTDVIASVVTRDPDWGKLPADTPAAVRRLIRRCLQRDPRRRLRDIGDAALELAEAPEENLAAPPANGRATKAGRARTARAAAAGVAVGLLGAWALWAVLVPAPADALPTWSGLPAPAGVRYDFTRFLEISPDGRRVVFVATGPEADEPTLWVRDLGSEAPVPLPGTEDAQQPFWSPDSRSIGYFARRKLRRISVEGGVSKTLADASRTPRGASWGADDTILYVPDWSQPIHRISAAGGTAEVVTKFNAERLELSHRWPLSLPDGKHFLFFVVSTYPELNPDNPTEADKSGVYIGSFDGAEPRLLQTARSRVAYTDGSLLYVDDGILMARPFDLAGLSFRGEAVTLAEGVTQSADALWGGALFSVSDEGTLLFVRGAPDRRASSLMRWFDREGKPLETIGEARPIDTLRISHDGRRVAVSIGDPSDIWVHDLERATSTRFTFDPGNDLTAIWSPDDKHILFQSNRVVPGQPFAPVSLFRKVASGIEPEERLAVVDFGPTLLPCDWSPDGRSVVLTAMRSETGADLTIYSVESGTFDSYLATAANEQFARFSPDGRWLAYESDASGRNEIYVQAFPGPGGTWQVSRDGGEMVAWRGDGEELFFRGPEGLMAVPVETRGGFRHGSPVRLFDVETTDTVGSQHVYDAAPDGRRFLLLTPAAEPAEETAKVTLVQRWRALID